jgi:hypothetical protein
MELVQALPRRLLSEFQPLLPPDLGAQLLAERLFYIEGLVGWMSKMK